MKKYISAFLVAAAALFSQSALAETHHCEALNYTLDMPAGWEVLDQRKMQDDPSILESAIKAAGRESWRTADKDMLGDVREMVDTGKVIYYVNDEYPNSVISVNEARGKLPTTEYETRECCESMAGDLSRLIGRPIDIYRCERRSVGNANALFLTMDAYMSGKKCLSYEIQKSANEMLVFTGVCPDQNCDALEQELQKMLESLKIG
jgi:hypothetical protein